MITLTTAFITGLAFGLGLVLMLILWMILPTNRAEKKKNLEQLEQLNLQHKRRADAMESIDQSLKRLVNLLEPRVLGRKDLK